MENKYYFYDNPSTNPYFNLALEEYLLKNRQEGNLFLLWQNESTVVIGRNQNVFEEVNEAFAIEHKIPITRRITGGGAVYHDLGNLNYSFITDYVPGKNNIKGHFPAIIVKALNALGVVAEYSGRNDILVNNKKVSGMAQRVYKDRLLHHGCILFDTDLSVMKKVLNGKTRPGSRAVKSIDSRVMNLSDIFLEETTIEELKRCFRNVICAGSDEATLELTEKERKNIVELMNDKYCTKKWIYGESPSFNIHNHGDFQAGKLDVYLYVKDGIIEECSILGDYMAIRPTADITRKLIGCNYNYDDIQSRLNGVTLSEYFGGIDDMDIIGCF